MRTTLSQENLDRHTSVDSEAVKHIVYVILSVSSSKVNAQVNIQQHTGYTIRSKKKKKFSLIENQLSKYRVIFISYFGKTKSLQQKTETSSQVIKVLYKLIFTSALFSLLKYKVI